MSRSFGRRTLCPKVTLCRSISINVQIEASRRTRQWWTAEHLQVVLMSLCRSLLFSIVKNISNRWFYSRLPERAKAYVSETIEDEQFIVAGTIRMQKRLPDLEGKRKIIHIAILLKKERKLSRVGRLRLSKIFSDLSCPLCRATDASVWAIRGA